MQIAPSSLLALALTTRYLTADEAIEARECVADGDHAALAAILIDAVGRCQGDDAQRAFEVTMARILARLPH